MNDTIIYQLRQRSPHEYQIKAGRKVAARIIRVTDGWYIGCTVRTTVDGAVAFFIACQESFADATGRAVRVEVQS